MSNQVVSLFPQTPISQSTEKRESSHSLTDSLTTTRARAREEIVAEIGAYYCATFGAATLPPIAERHILSALATGMDEGLIYNAIDEAAMAPRPSWAYAAAILRRLMQEGVKTWDEYEERQNRWHARHYRR